MGDWLDDIRWSPEGLVPAIAQDAASGDVLMLAWMSRESLERTLREGEAVYWSRSRGRLWKKGERSGHVQEVEEVRLDCDGDALLLRVVQRGGIACHTGRRRCFYRRFEGRFQGRSPRERAEEGEWASVEPVLESPADIYGEG